MSPRSRLARDCAAVLFLMCIFAIGTGCSRVERVKIINHFGQPVRIRLYKTDTNPLVPAHGEAFLDRNFYIGSGIRVTVLTAQGRLLRAERFIDVPGDSAFRRFAIVEVRP